MRKDGGSELFLRPFSPSLVEQVLHVFHVVFVLHGTTCSMIHSMTIVLFSFSVTLLILLLLVLLLLVLMVSSILLGVMLMVLLLLLLLDPVLL